ncbi:MAG: hypothetical protein A2Y07_07260 [Planctomycetes bacterium GWF2_50_10]|nr:MAG: hypothetical protein A2Y07_07260 [Planctomycetes bacterium GWF2_50_10]
MFRTILVATDLSEASDRVIECLHELREWGAEKAILVHALGVRHLEEIARLLTLEAEPTLAQQKAKLESQGFEATLEIASGVPGTEINRIAEQRKVSLIVVGSHGATCAREMLLGGAALAILHKATVPVLLVRIKVGEPEALAKCELACRNFKRHILFATDFSDTAKRAFSYLEKIAECGPEKITLLHVQDKVKIDKHLRNRLDEFNRIDAERLEHLKSSLQKRGVQEIKIELPYGFPIQEIVNHAKYDAVSLIIMGSQGRGFISEVLLGSVSHNVARHATVPVLLISAKRIKMS